jgi:predicted permease
VIAVLAAIAASTLAGVAAERRWGRRAVDGTGRLITALVWGVSPLITFFVIARLELDGGVGAGLALAFAELTCCGLLVWWAGTRLLRLPRPAVGTLIVTVILANTGYLGTPLIAALLGRDAIAEAVAYDVVVSFTVLYTAAWAVGAAFGTNAGEGVRQRTRAFFTRNPVVYALTAALLAPDALAPEALVDVAEVAAIALLPVGFFILGVHLTHENEEGVLVFPPPFTLPVGVAVATRLAIAPALLLAFTRPLDAVPDAYLLQAAMPSGINSLVVAHTYGLDLRLAASVVAWTTAAVIVLAVPASAII